MVNTFGQFVSQNEVLSVYEETVAPKKTEDFQ